MSIDVIHIRDNLDGTWTVYEPTGCYDDVTVNSETEAVDEAEAMAYDLGLVIVKD